MDIPRRKPEDEALIKARQDVAGRLGFTLGCVGAVSAIGLILYRAPDSYSFAAIATAVLVSAFNVPIGILLGLLAERVTRPRRGRK